MHGAFYNIDLDEINSLLLRTLLLIVLEIVKNCSRLYLGKEPNRVLVHLNLELKLPVTLYLTLLNGLKIL